MKVEVGLEINWSTLKKRRHTQCITNYIGIVDQYNKSIWRKYENYGVKT